jgi:hypothetical protein
VYVLVATKRSRGARAERAAAYTARRGREASGPSWRSGAGRRSPADASPSPGRANPREKPGSGGVRGRNPMEHEVKGACFFAF